MRAPFVVMYRWRLAPGREAEFVSAWSARSAWLKGHGGSLGSRLHKGSDGLWYSYAQWPSEQARERAFAMSGDANRERNRAIMSDAITEELPEIVLSVESDHLDLARVAVES